MIFLICAVVAAGVTPMLVEAWRGEFTFVNPKNPFVAYYVVQLAISALVTMSAGSQPSIGLDYAANHGTYEDALWMSLGGLISFHAGYYLYSGRAAAVPKLVLRPWTSSRANLVAAICCLAGMVAFAALIEQAGGFAAFRENREGWRAGGMIGQGILIFPATGLIVLAMHVLFLTHVNSQTRQERVASIVLAYAVGLAPSIVLGFRSLIFLPLLQLMVLWHFRRRVLSRVWLVAALALFAIGFTIYGIVRELPPETGISTRTIATTVRDRPELLMATVARSRGLEVLATVIHRLRETGAYDASAKGAVEALTVFIPRSIWKAKPLSSGERFTTYFFGDDFVLTRGITNETFGGMSPTIVGEFYWHFGLAGVLGGLFLFGMVVRIAYKTVRRCANSNGALLVYVYLYSTIAMMAETFQNYLNGLVLTSIAIGGLLLALTIKLSPAD